MSQADDDGDGDGDDEQDVGVSITDTCWLHQHAVATPECPSTLGWLID